MPLYPHFQSCLDFQTAATQSQNHQSRRNSVQRCTTSESTLRTEFQRDDFVCVSAVSS